MKCGVAGIEGKSIFNVCLGSELTQMLIVTHIHELKIYDILSKLIERIKNEAKKEKRILSIKKRTREVLPYQKPSFFYHCS